MVAPVTRPAMGTAGIKLQQARHMMGKRLHDQGQGLRQQQRVQPRGGCMGAKNSDRVLL